MSATLVEMMKGKIEEANNAIKNQAADLKDGDTRKQEIGKQIAHMTQLLKELEGKDEKTMETFKEKVNESIAEFDKLVKA